MGVILIVVFVLFVLIYLPGFRKEAEQRKIFRGDRDVVCGTVVSKRGDHIGRIPPYQLWKRKEVIDFPYFERGHLGKIPKYTFFYVTIRDQTGTHREYQVPYDLYAELTEGSYVSMSVRDGVVLDAKDFVRTDQWKKKHKKRIAVRTVIVVVVFVMYVAVLFAENYTDNVLQNGVSAQTIPVEETEELLIKLGLPEEFSGDVTGVHYQEKASAFGSRIDVEYLIDEEETEDFIRALGSLYFEVETPYQMSDTGFVGEEAFPSSFARAEDRLFFFGEEAVMSIYAVVPSFDQVLMEAPADGTVRVLAVFGMPNKEEEALAKKTALGGRRSVFRLF